MVCFLGLLVISMSACGSSDSQVLAPASVPENMDHRQVKKSSGTSREEATPCQEAKLCCHSALPCSNSAPEKQPTASPKEVKPAPSNSGIPQDFSAPGLYLIDLADLEALAAAEPGIPG